LYTSGLWSALGNIVPLICSMSDAQLCCLQSVDNILHQVAHRITIQVIQIDVCASIRAVVL